jgi:hypothetical protein
VTVAVIGAVAVGVAPPACSAVLPERAPRVAASPTAAVQAAVGRSAVADPAWPETTLRVVVLGAALAAARAFAALFGALLPEFSFGARRVGRGPFNELVPATRQASPEPVRSVSPAPPATPAATVTRPVSPASPAMPAATVTRPAKLQALARSAGEIRWWRGYVKSAFYAVVRDDGEERVLAQSPMFRWRGASQPPREPATEDALRVLIEALEARGWTVSGGGTDWYALRLRRTHEA